VCYSKNWKLSLWKVFSLRSATACKLNLRAGLSYTIDINLCRKCRPHGSLGIGNGSRWSFSSHSLHAENTSIIHLTLLIHTPTRTDCCQIPNCSVASRAAASQPTRTAAHRSRIQLTSFFNTHTPDRRVLLRQPLSRAQKTFRPGFSFTKRLIYSTPLVPIRISVGSLRRSQHVS